MDIFVISDTHFGHKKMITWSLRPLDFEEKLWKSMDLIPEGAALIHCGDITFGEDNLVHERLKTYRFKKWLVKGNHDNHSNSWYLSNGWDFVCDEFVISIFGKNILFSHAPLPKRDGIDINIHGHLHGGKSRGRPDYYNEDYHKEVTPEVVGYNLVRLNIKLLNK